MVDRKGNVSLIDFGASKQRSNKGGATTSTAVSFTNGFAPREQMEQNLEKFGPWTDLYALGATLYNLLANQKPPMPSDIDDDRSADKHLALPLPSGISEKTRQLILRLMTTDRLDRPQSVAEVRNLIEGVKPKATESTRILYAAEETIVVDKKPKEKVHTSPTPQIQEPPQRKSIKMEEPQIDVTEDEDNKSNYQVPLFLGFAVIAFIVSFFFFFFCDEKNTPAEVIEPASNAIEEVVDSTAAAFSIISDFNNNLGKFDYEGEVNNDELPNGIGEATFHNGNYYKGPFRNGNLEGENGEFKFKNGDTFKGSFKNNYFNQGTYTVAETGEYFIGTFEKGSPAHGTWYDKGGKELETIASNNIKTDSSARTIMDPTVRQTTAERTKINSVTLAKDYTAVKITTNNESGDSYYEWCNIDKGTYLVVNGLRYTMTKAEGIKVAPGKTYFSNDGQDLTFVLFFPSISKSAKEMDLIEPGSNWQFYGINLN